jgi:hypothetical protein
MKKNTYSTGLVLYASLALAMSIAAPRQSSADAPSFCSLLNPSAQRSSGSGSGQQPPSQRPPRSGNNGPVNSRPPVHSRPPQNGGDPSQGRPPRPNPGPNPPSPPTGDPVTNPGNSAPGQVRPPSPGRPPVRPPAHPSPRPPVYHYPPFGPRPGFIWGGGNGWRLHQFFLGNRPLVRPIHRHHFYVGGYFPSMYLPYMQPIPIDLLEYLPPVPPGYDIGYFDGYGLVYDSNTLRVLSAIDLYRY